MYNLPIHEKVVKALKAGDLTSLLKYNAEYDFEVAASGGRLCLTTGSHVQLYELLAARIVCREQDCQHFMEVALQSEKVTQKGKIVLKDKRIRRLVLVNPRESSGERYDKLMELCENALKHWYNRGKVKGLRACRSFRVGFLWEWLEDTKGDIKQADLTRNWTGVKLRHAIARAKITEFHGFAYDKGREEAQAAMREDKTHQLFARAS